MSRDGLSQSRQTFSVSATAARLEVAPSTLRTWARRHGMEPSEHSSGTHRRYTEHDLAKLMTMRTLILRGASTSEAARLANAVGPSRTALAKAERELKNELATLPGASEPSHENPARTQNGIRSVPALVGKEHAAPPKEAPVLRLAIHNAPTEDPTDYKFRCTTLVSAALRDDQEACAQLLAVTDGESFIDWWKLLVRPALDRISSHTVLAAPGKTPRLLVGYLAQRAIAQRMAQVRPDLQTQERPHPSRLKNITLVFAPERDDLAIPAHALAAALLEQQCNAHVILGPENERRVVELVRIVRPSVVAFVSHHIAPSTDLLGHLSKEFGELPIYVGLHEGVDIGDLRRLPHVNTIGSFRAMFHEIYNSVRASDPSAQYWPEEESGFHLKSMR